MAFARGPAPVTSGKYDAAGASRSTSPSLTASPIAEAVNVFDREYLCTLSLGRYGSQLVEAMTWPCRMTVSAKGLMPFPSQASTRARIARGSTPCASGDDAGGRYGFTRTNLAAWVIPGERRHSPRRTTRPTEVVVNPATLRRRWIGVYGAVSTCRSIALLGGPTMIGST